MVEDSDDVTNGWIKLNSKGWNGDDMSMEEFNQLQKMEEWYHTCRRIKSTPWIWVDTYRGIE